MDILFASFDQSLDTTPVLKIRKKKKQFLHPIHVNRKEYFLTLYLS